MQRYRVLSIAFAACLALPVIPAGATDSHDYAKDEYAIIQDGLAPDKRLSLAAHGEGDGGTDNFHVWLMAEPAHRRIAELEAIGSSNNLDTGPDSHRAQWSMDSRHVAVSFRSDRHVLQLNLYGIEGSRAALIRGPRLFRDVTSRDVGPNDDLRLSTVDIVWTGSRRFVLKERRSFLTSDPAFKRALGWYGRAMEEAGDGREVVEFSAEADCVLISANRYRILDLRIGMFSQ
jgi:hypothetical protein